MPRFLGLSVTGQVAQANQCGIAELDAFNSGAAAIFLKLYDKATAPTTNDTPTYTLMVPAGGGLSRSYKKKRFKDGCSIRATTVAADADASAPGGTDVTVNLDMTN